MGIIRTLLALAVVLFHSYGFWNANQTMTGGMVSVQAFYMISGFYMALIIHEKYSGKKNSYRLFLSNRFLRIYPVYWACLIIVILMCLIGQLFIIILILANIFLFGTDLLMFTGVNAKSGNLEWTKYPFQYQPMTGQYLIIPQIWTVGLELTFYLLAPLVVRMKWYVQVLLILLAIYYHHYLFYTRFLQFDPWSYRFFPTQLGLFVAGSVAYRVYRYIREIKIPSAIHVSLWLIILYCIVFYPSLTFISEGKLRVGFFSILFVGLPFIFLLFRENKIDRFIGELSFPIYVCHHFIMFLWRKYFWVHYWQMQWFGIATAVSSVIFAIGLYFLLIKRLERIRQRRISTQQQLN